ncbi:MAG: VIT1/CCC1 transporter family protein [Humibacillus sp.]|nr:VIT1/CCC1 transporter family protein [Humibacillus sp.]MDN5777987.1 VIT1/CCC1 transporter family protein [Humibacillus sp.]
MSAGDPLNPPAPPVATPVARPHLGRRLWVAVDPASSLVEVLVAVVLALGIITGVRAGLFGDLTPHDTALVILATALAWGVIDGGLYLVGSKMDQGRLDHLAGELRGADLPAARRRALAAEAFALDLDDRDHHRLVAAAYDALADALAADSAERRFTRDDWKAAATLFLWSLLVSALVSLTLLLPVAATLAFTLAQGVGMVLLFGAGYLWARRTRYNRVWAGLLLAAIGALMILLAFVFGAI